jgi:hypothetical protein
MWWRMLKEGGCQHLKFLACGMLFKLLRVDKNLTLKAGLLRKDWILLSGPAMGMLDVRAQI